MEQKNSSKEMKSENGILKATGSSIPYQMAILIWSIPNVLNSPANMDKSALIIKPA